MLVKCNKSETCTHECGFKKYHMEEDCKQCLLDETAKCIDIQCYGCNHMAHHPTPEGHCYMFREREEGCIKRK